VGDGGDVGDGGGGGVVVGVGGGAGSARLGTALTEKIELE
jgi:hypothetical protein